MKAWLLALVSSMVAAMALPAEVARDFSGDRRAIEAIFAAHDRLQPGLDEYMNAVADDIVLMPNGGKSVEGKAAYREHVIGFYTSGSIRIRHELIAVDSFPEVAIARGRAVGTFAGADGVVHAFETRNVFVFRRGKSGALKVWQIIFNDAPRGS